MVKGSLHFHIKIMYVSLYTQLIYRKEHMHNATMQVVKAFYTSSTLLSRFSETESCTTSMVYNVFCTMKMQIHLS